MFTDIDAADLCSACYSNTGIFDRIGDPDGVWCGVKRQDGATAVAFRGSTTIQDWFRDFEGCMIQDPDLGGVEHGFMQGIHELMPFILPLLTGDIMVTGHSLGAARALLFAALLPPGYEPTVITFGSPRPGGHKVKEILTPYAVRSYRNGDDPVCDVPRALDIPPWDYQHPHDQIAVNIPALPGDEWGILRRHHIFLYQQAMKDLYGS